MIWLLVGCIGDLRDEAFCDAPELDLEWREAISPGHVLILGEMHGTKEIPELTAAAVCDALRAGRSVGLFVEWPTSLQDELSDESRLLADPFFQSTFQDGRRSRAMLRLVVGTETWATKGAPVSVIAMDPADAERDAGMASVVRGWLATHAQSVAIVLVGNIHARLVKGWRENPSYEPLGFRLLDLGDRVRSLDVRYAGGAAWTCQPECGIHPLYGESRGDEWRIEWSARRAYDGTFYVGTPTASLPAARP